MAQQRQRAFGSAATGNVRPAGSTTVRLSEVLAGLSYALDLTEGQRPGHSMRSCAIGMRLAGQIRLPHSLRSPLFYALLMKDLGCSSNAARFAALFDADDQSVKATLKLTNWSEAIESYRFVARNVAPGHFWLRRVWQLLAVLACGPAGARAMVRTRCERGAEISRMLGFSPHTVEAIRALDEHWDGCGQPYSLKREQIPLLGRILGLAQTVEVFWSTHGLDAACDMAVARRGTWFDPMLVRALEAIRTDAPFWDAMGRGHTLADISAFEPADHAIVADDARLDLVAEAFARVVDAKSPWTCAHSTGVARLSTDIGHQLGLAAADLGDLRRAALLHDLGKLSVSSLILDKPGPLTGEEFGVMRRHPDVTHAMLSRVACFRRIASEAAAHHERLDGHGYHRGLSGRKLKMAARVLGVADICDALQASRPYRAGLPAERVLEVMRRDVGAALDPDCYAALRVVLAHQRVADAQAAVPAVQIVPALAEDYAQAA
jgi:HD-GYP domain-containing protein (c-di-GMP phosphodiesterase class II)